MTDRLSVLFETEGTYPFVGGGVSTWCDILVRELPQVDYHICAITGDPNVKLKYDLMPNVRRVIHVPLWGTEEPAEFILPEVPFSEIYLRKQETTHQVIEEDEVVRRRLRERDHVYVVPRGVVTEGEIASGDLEHATGAAHREVRLAPESLEHVVLE